MENLKSSARKGFGAWDALIGLPAAWGEFYVVSGCSSVATVDDRNCAVP